jgi:acyl-coenzyme A thioesterase PaaI-like protein
MDYEAVCAGLQAAIPYNNHVGLEYTEVGKGIGVVILPDADHLKNHVG